MQSQGLNQYYKTYISQLSGLTPQLNLSPQILKPLYFPVPGSVADISKETNTAYNEEIQPGFGDLTADADAIHISNLYEEEK